MLLRMQTTPRLSKVLVAAASVTLAACTSAARPMAFSPEPSSTPIHVPPPAVPATSAVGTPSQAMAAGASVTLPDGVRLAVESIVVDGIAPPPDARRADPAGSAVTVTMTLAGKHVTLSRLAAGHHEPPVAWIDELRVALVRADATVAHLAVHRVTDRVVATKQLRVAAGERIRLHDVLDFELVGHSHKRVTPEMESPLMVDVDYHDGRPHGRTHSLFPPREVTWRWHEVRFTLGAYEYDRWMDLVVERLALEQVLPAP